MIEKLERKEIVSNGCSGKCCTKFTMKWSLGEMKAKHKKNDFSKSSDIEKVLDMLIPLGTTTIDPQTGISFERRWKFKYKVKKRDMKRKFTESYAGGGHIFFHNGKAKAHIFTCKHFDKKNKICGNYEDRPSLCRSFGVGCEYKGCGFDKLKLKS